VITKQGKPTFSEGIDMGQLTEGLSRAVSQIAKSLALSLCYR